MRKMYEEDNLGIDLAGYHETGAITILLPLLSRAIAPYGLAFRVCPKPYMMQPRFRRSSEPWRSLFAAAAGAFWGCESLGVT